MAAATRFALGSGARFNVYECDPDVRIDGHRHSDRDWEPFPVKWIERFNIPKTIRCDDTVGYFEISPPFVVYESSPGSDVRGKGEQCAIRIAAEDRHLDHAFVLPDGEQQTKSISFDFVVVGNVIVFSSRLNRKEVQEVNVIPFELRHQGEPCVAVTSMKGERLASAGRE